MMPIQGSKVRTVEKRPATRLATIDIPLSKRGKCDSKESVKSDVSEDNLIK